MFKKYVDGQGARLYYLREYLIRYGSFHSGASIFAFANKGVLPTDPECGAMRRAE
jgi:hypothetical protein